MSLWLSQGLSDSDIGLGAHAPLLSDVPLSQKNGSVSAGKNIPKKGDPLLDWAGDPFGVSSSFIELYRIDLISYLNKPTGFESSFV